MDYLNLRKNFLEIANKTVAGHIGSSLSCIDILNAVYSIVDIEKIQNNTNDRDRVILSKGHAALALYTVMAYHGLMDKHELLKYISKGSIYAGHPNHAIKFVEHSTGALGHGLPIATGIALGLKSQGLSGNVYCILGDGDMQEGSNWEALMYAGNSGLSNLCILIDNNNLSGIGNTNESCSLEPLSQKLVSFKFNTLSVDGHNADQISDAIRNNKKPLALICKTVKGKGISFMENNNVWHYRPLNNTDYEKALKELSGL